MKVIIEDLDDISDVREAVMEIYSNCPHTWNDEEITTEITKGIMMIEDKRMKREVEI